MCLGKIDIEVLYCEALLALKFVLEQSEIRSWAKWIATDLDRWETEKSVQHHISAYGGMGSLSDLIICTENKHSVTKAQEPWANSLLLDLCSLCYAFAIALKDQKEIPLEKLFNSMGCYGDKLQGWRCRSCGYGEVSVDELENYVAHILVRSGIMQALLSDNLYSYIEKTFNLDIPGVEEYRENLKKLIGKSNITISNRKGWLRPCPTCSSEDTVIYRWEKQKKRKYFLFQVEVIEPSKDNLLMH